MLIQRVKEASVVVDAQTVGAIHRGAVVFLGIRKGDSLDDVSYLVDKLINLRFFPDENNKMHLSLLDMQAAVLIISQFTLYGNCSQGRRPDFFDAEIPAKAEPLYQAFVEKVGHFMPSVQTGRFGAHMLVHLINDGPVTLLIDSG